MRKRAYFDTYWGEGWPDLKWLERYFLAPPGHQWLFETRNDSGNLTVEGVDGTADLERNKGRIDIDLIIDGNREYGIHLYYRKWGGGLRESFWSRGDLTRLGEHVRSLHGTPLPVGLFIPFEVAWKAIKEFIETNGQLPKSIAWIANKDLPPNTFPDP